MKSTAPLSTLAQDPSSPITKDEATHQALENLKLLHLDDAIDEPRYEFVAVLRAKLAPRAKLNKLKKVADKINAAALPRSACRSGCSHCCNISVIISETDAQAISSATGIKAKKPKSSRPDIASTERWFAKPCTFLREGRCSIYEVRPIACRLMFNLADSPYFCDTKVPSADSHVTMLNLKDLEHEYVQAFLSNDWGDIRDFFPPKA